jgi:hypothetical protein
MFDQLEGYGSSNSRAGSCHHGNLVFPALHSETIRPSLSNACNWLASKNRVHFEKLMVARHVKTFPTFHEIYNFITVFTKALEWIMFWGNFNLSTTSHIISLKYIPVSSYLHMFLQSSDFSWRFPTKLLYTLLISPI